MHKAILYEPLDDNRVNCTACKQYCIIPDNHVGLCGVRYNKDGALYLLVYGKSVAYHVDPIEKKPLYHFLPGTNAFSIGTVGCNFSCSFCQNYDISQVTRKMRQRYLLENRIRKMEEEVPKFGSELTPKMVTERCLVDEISIVAYTYNEPAIFFEYAYDSAVFAHEENIKNVFVSNGYESDIALETIHPYLDAMNIDLKSFSDEFYKKICKGHLKPVLDTIKKAHELGIWLEITTLVIPRHNDSKEELQKIAEFIAGIDPMIPWHISAFYPAYKMADVSATHAETLLMAYDIGKDAGLHYIYVGNILDEKHSTTYCHSCNTPLIRRNGYAVEIEDEYSEGTCDKCKTPIPGVWR